MLATVVRGCVVAVSTFGAERGAETMWPDVSPWTWWGGVAALLSAWVAVEVWLRQRRVAVSVDGAIVSEEAPPVIPWHASLERCQTALVEYVEVPSGPVIGQTQIAATYAFLPYIYDLCQRLDEEGIPHPEIRKGLTFTGTGEWGEFLAKLWAVRHDPEAAKQVWPKMMEERT